MYPARHYPCVCVCLTCVSFGFDMTSRDQQPRRTVFDDGLPSFWCCSFSFFIYLLVFSHESKTRACVFNYSCGSHDQEPHTHTSENPSKFCVLLFSPPFQRAVGLDWTGLGGLDCIYISGNSSPHFLYGRMDSA
jgi:hypothetical protein